MPCCEKDARCQQGVALITALFVVVLATMAAVSMVSRQHLDIRRTSNLLGQEQTYFISLAAERYALKYLAETDIEDLPWDGCISPPIPVTLDQVRTEIWVEDMHCRFNLNALAGEDKEAEKGFVRLLEVLRSGNPEASFDPEQIVVAVRDWMDPETDDPVYQRNEPPYLSANQRMLLPSELRWVRGVDTALWRLLTPYVTALPESDAPMRVGEFSDTEIRDAFSDNDTGREAVHYYRLNVHAELDNRTFMLCALLDTKAREVVWRKHSACETIGQ